jgi:hypothetical protein
MQTDAAPAAQPAVLPKTSLLYADAPSSRRFAGGLESESDAPKTFQLLPGAAEC